MRKTSGDAILQKQLEALMGAGDGNISSAGELDDREAQALKGERGSLVTEFANQKGFEFSKTELDTVVDAFGRHQSGELSLGQLSEVLGLSELELQPQDALPSMKKTVELVYRGIRYQKSGGTLIPMDSLPNKPLKYRGAKIQETQGATPIQRVLQFMHETSSDAILQKQLEALMGAGDGNISGSGELDVEEARALKGERGLLVTEFANQKGFAFSKADLETVVDAFEGYRAGVLSEEDLGKVLGPSDVNRGSLQKAVSLVYRGLRYATS